MPAVCNDSGEATSGSRACLAGAPGIES